MNTSDHTRRREKGKGGHLVPLASHPGFRARTQPASPGDGRPTVAGQAMSTFAGPLRALALCGIEDFGAGICEYVFTGTGADQLRPGQHVLWHDSASGRALPLAVSNTANGHNEWRLLVQPDTEDGAIAQGRLDAMRPGDDLMVQGPFGGLTVDLTDSRQLLVLADAAGLAHALALLRRLKRENPEPAISIIAAKASLPRAARTALVSVCPELSIHAVTPPAAASWPDRAAFEQDPAAALGRLSRLAETGAFSACPGSNAATPSAVWLFARDVAAGPVICPAIGEEIAAPHASVRPAEAAKCGVMSKKRFCLMSSDTSDNIPREEESRDGGRHMTVKEFDVRKRYVRITGIRNNNLIEFDFSVGEPGLYVELALPLEAFQEFCAVNDVHYLSTEEAAAVDFDKLKWRYGKPGVTA